MRILTEMEYQQEAQPVFQQIFLRGSMMQPFSPSITERVIIYRCELYFDPLLTQGLFAGATRVGDVGCYYTQLWRTQGKSNDAYIPLSELCEIFGVSSDHPWFSSPDLEVDLSHLDLEKYINIVGENALYSATGQWGITSSHERFGALGGSPEFMEEVRRFVPNLDRQVYDFLRNYQVSKAEGMRLTLGWLPGFLSHIYGQKAAEQILQEAGLP